MIIELAHRLLHLHPGPFTGLAEVSCRGPPRVKVRQAVRASIFKRGKDLYVLLFNFLKKIKKEKH